MNLPEFHALFFSRLPSNSIPISSSSSFHLSFPFFLRCMMWMLGYNYDDAARKLRPLLPRPSAFPDHFLGFVEQDKRDNIVAISQQVVVSSRWNPTPEQLQTLEELYRRGTRTPSADQIQQITSQLRRYGKIEGKNVFYWFQNHKARERQKRRRQLSDNNNNDDETEKGLEKRTEAPTTGNEGSNRAAFGVEQTKDWASPTKCSTISVKTTQGATKGAECKSVGWVELDIDAHEIVSHNKQSRNATWQVHKRPHDNFINIFDLEPYLINPHHHEEEAQTLQLFPVESVHEEEIAPEEEGECATMSGGASDPITTPYRFFEFLPLKN